MIDMGPIDVAGSLGSSMADQTTEYALTLTAAVEPLLGSFTQRFYALTQAGAPTSNGLAVRLLKKPFLSKERPSPQPFSVPAPAVTTVGRLRLLKVSFSKIRDGPLLLATLPPSIRPTAA